MKYLRFVLALLIAISAITVFAQDSEIAFENVEIEAYGVSADVPINWQNPAPGTYVRGESATDPTVLAVQSLPLTLETLISAMEGQFGLETFPEPETEIETAFAAWTVYRIDNEVPPMSATIIIAYQDNVSYVLVGQSTREEHETLREAVFMPVLETIALLAVEEDTEMLEVPYTVEDVTFENGDITLAGTLTTPEGEGEFPVVILASGTAGHDRDESLAPIAEIKPFRDIADYLTRKGIAVLRYDDRGIAESEGDFVTADIYDFRDDASAAIDYLAGRNQFSHIGIVGHSEGGTYAPEVGITNDNVDFVVSLAGATGRVVDVLPYQVQALTRAEGLDEETVTALGDAMTRLIEAYDSGDEDRILESIQNFALAQPGVEEASEQTIELLQRQYTSPLYVSYFEYDPAPFWEDVDVPMLAVYGTLDAQVSAEDSIAFLEGINANITIVTIENMNHIFQIAETGGMSEYATLEQSVTPELLEILTEWILEITAQ